MRESNTILDQISTRRTSRGGVVGWHTGILRDSPHPISDLSVGSLASIHNTKWPIVGQPPLRVQERIFGPINRVLNTELRKQSELNRRPPIMNRGVSISPDDPRLR